jgi:uncharacterized protein YcnI
MRKLVLAASIAATPLVAAPAAQAHVTLNPRTAVAGSFARLDVRVPNERDDAATRTVVVNFPDGFYSVSYKRVWGWTAKVTMAKLSTPVKTGEGTVTERVAKIAWRATAKRYRIAPGQFEEFGLSAQVPNTPGATLTFPSTQTYDSGEVVRWTGPAGADTPAPTVSVVAAAS